MRRLDVTTHRPGRMSESAHPRATSDETLATEKGGVYVQHPGEDKPFRRDVLMCVSMARDVGGEPALGYGRDWRPRCLAAFR